MLQKLKKKTLYGVFLSVQFNCFKDTEPLRGESSVFIFRSPGLPGTHFINLEKMRAESTTHWF